MEYAFLLLGLFLVGFVMSNEMQRHTMYKKMHEEAMYIRQRGGFVKALCKPSRLRHVRQEVALLVGVYMASLLFLLAHRT